jgi:zinc D-Ala-D-Ala carboxypeptidase
MSKQTKKTEPQERKPTAMKLSKNFSLKEMTFSDTAIRKGIDNTPSVEHIVNLTVLCAHVLQPVREHYGKAVNINSGYRSVELCEAVGSSAKSQHARGEAADFEIYGLDNEELATWVYNNVDFDQLILEFYNPGDPNSGWVHCSYTKEGENRKQALIINNETKGKYLPWKPKA